MLAMDCHPPLAIWVYISIIQVTATDGLHRTPVGASTLAMVCHPPPAIWVYISIIQVTATYGFALTASHLEEPQVTKGSCPCRSVPRLGSACPRSGPAPWARRDRPSMA
jgi:hypothetical protein